MKILIWTQYFWPENFRINALAKTLQKKGIEVTVLTGKPNYPQGDIYPGYTANGITYDTYHDIEVIRIPLAPRGQGSPTQLFKNYISFIVSGYTRAPFALKGRHFDAVLVYAPSPLLQALPAILVAYLKKASLAVWVQDIWPDSLESTGFIKNRFLLGIVSLMVRYIYRFSDLLLIPSESFRALIERHVSKKEKIKFFPNAVDKDALLNNLKVEVADELKERFSVVFAGNIGIAQSCETILAAAHILRNNHDICIYLVGSGSQAEKIGRRIALEGLTNIKMLGRFESQDMPQLYAAASALLLTLRDEEVFAATVPSKLQSYFAAGKPLVASAKGETSRIVAESQAGLTCPPEDPEALASAIIQIYEMDDLEHRQLGENGRNYFEAHYDLNMSVEKLLSYLEQH